MTNYIFEHENEPFDNLESVLAAIGYSLASKNKFKDVAIFSKSNSTLEYTNHDNWNGGTSSWTLNVEIPYPDYESYSDDERIELESFINNVMKPFIPDMGYWVSAKLKPMSLNDPDWRKNIIIPKSEALTSEGMVRTGFDSVQSLVELLTEYATGKNVLESDFSELRAELLRVSNLTSVLPPWLKTYRNLKSFWGFIQPKFGTYAERRTFLANEFAPALNALEFGQVKEVVVQQEKTHFVDKLIENRLNIDTKKKVFIVHGRDNEVKQEVARYLESLDIEVIILHEKASGGMTIIEKIEHYANEADFALVLYTACDRGRGAHETKIPANNRARQNVIFEHGYLMAKLGRKNVCALKKGKIETPNDISGVVYVDLDIAGAWKIIVNKELMECGYNLS